MALKVPDIGEIESIRFLVNSTQTTPRNLILKLLTNGSATTWGGEAETDTPATLRTATFVEPYTYAVGSGGSAASPKSYPLASVAQYTGGAITSLPYSNQFGILLHGTNWRVQTTGTTQATYPEQTFTFVPDTSFYVHGYCVVRANSFAQTFLNNLTGGATITANSSTYTLTASTATSYGNVLGGTQLQIDPTVTLTSNVSSSANSTLLTTSGSTTGIQVGMYAVGTGVGPYARVTAVPSATTVVVSMPCTGAIASGTVKFYEGRIAPGQGVSGTGVAASTTVSGYDPNTGIVFVNNLFTANVTGTITFTYSLISATAHGGLIGDTVFVTGTGGTAVITAGSGGVFTVNDGGAGSASGANAFSTYPNIPCTSAGTIVIYDNIMYEEKFTNGPYYIQNSGDQIKITLNVSLD